MGAADWDATLQRPATAAGGVPTRDVSVGPDGMELTLGDTHGRIVPTPGHTPGTLSYIFPVKDQGQPVMVAYSGGTLTGAFGTNGAKWDEYIASQKKIAKAAADAEATCHPVQSQRVRRRVHQGAAAAGAASGGRKSPVHRRRRRGAALLHGDVGVRDGVEAAGWRKVNRRLGIWCSGMELTVPEVAAKVRPCCPQDP